MGTTTGDIIRMLLKQFVKRRAIHADSPEDEALAPAAWRQKLWDDMESGKLNNPNAKPTTR